MSNIQKVNRNKLVSEFKKKIRENSGKRFVSAASVKSRNSTRCIVDVSILFDATGSQSPYWNAMHSGINRTVGNLLQLSKYVRIGMIAYRDYLTNGGDTESKVIEVQNFTTSPSELQNFCKSVVCRDGGDYPEAVESALAHACELFKNSSQPRTHKVVILIGDAPAHGVVDSFVEGKPNFRTEVVRLAGKSIAVYTVLTNENDSTTREHFQWIASKTGGKSLTLSKIDDLPDIITMVVGRETGQLEQVKKLLLSGPGKKSKERLMLELLD